MNKIDGLTIVYVLVTLSLIYFLFQTQVPLCYDIPQEAPSTFISYDDSIIEELNLELEKNPFNYVQISGTSMEPSIKHNQNCLCVREANYQVGDIIAFYVRTTSDKVKLISHRIVEKDPIITQGDNNHIEDSYKLTNKNIFCKIPEKSLLEKFKFIITQ